MKWAAVVVLAGCGGRAVAPPAPASPPPPWHPLDGLRGVHRKQFLDELAAAKPPRLLAIQLGEGLASADSSLQLAILDVLGARLGQLDAAIPYVAKLADTGSPSVQRAALAALVPLAAYGDSPAGEATDAYLHALARTPDPGERAYLVKQLGLVHAAPRAWAAMLEPFQGAVAQRKRDAANALYEAIGPGRLPDDAFTAFAAIVKREPDGPARGLLLRAFARSEDPRVVAIAIAALTDADESARESAVIALGEAGPVAIEAENALVEIVASTEEKMRMRAYAAGALAHIHARSQHAAEVLVDAATMPREHLIERMRSDGREQLRSPAESAVEAMGVAAMPALLAHPGEESAELLCKHDVDAKAAPMLIGLLGTDTDDRMRGRIEYCLAKLGPRAASAGPKLVKLLASRDPLVRAGAAYALAHLGTLVPGTIPGLLAMLRHARDEHERTWRDAEADGALLALALLGHRDGRDEIEGWLAREPCESAAAAVALVGTKLAPERGIQTLDELLAVPQAWSRRCAVMKLALLADHPAGKDLLPLLAAALSDANVDVREQAETSAAENVHAHLAELLPALQAELRTERADRHPREQYELGVLAGKLGAAGAPLVPDLIARLRKDGHAFVAPLVAIGRVTPGVADRVTAAFVDDGGEQRALAAQVAAGIASP